MARKVILDTQYTFNPTTRTITIPRHIPQERLMLITNTTRGQVIYNFSDANLKATGYSTSSSGASNTTTIVLNYNTSAMSASDKLSVMIDEYDEKFTPSETYLDPVNKLRVSTPQSLIDTDFEYGTQPTKWENIALIGQNPGAYPNQTPLTVTAMTMNTNARVVTVNTTTPPAVGTPVFVQDAILPYVNGLFVVESVVAGTSFSYTTKAVNNTSITAVWDGAKTTVFSANWYTNSAIGLAPTLSVSGSDLRVTVTTTVAHGLSAGNEIAVTGITGTNPPNGNFIVATVTSPTQFIYYANPSVGNPSGLTATAARVYPRPQSLMLHRPLDGGVLFGSNTASNNVSAVRQTRRYFRYQSGKGVQVSSGTLMRPYAGIESLVSTGTTVTVTTREQHNIAPGTTVIVSGANESAYNGTFTVVSTPTFNKFTYTALSTPSQAVASGPYIVSVSSWWGAKNRLGLFDSGNGMFFEFDGQQLYAVRRSSTYQIGGRVTATNGSTTVTQTNAEYPTALSRQLTPGDSILIRGQVYRVQDIASDTSMTITPAYRGPTVNFALISRVTETRIPQSQFNIDKLDGTGPSGYNMDLSRMQMFYIDYTWYGAGFVRWGVRGPNGDVIYCHKMPNNNVNSEAHMRSGNLPARYESVTEVPLTTITSSIGASDSVINVASTANFPSSGTLVVRSGSVYEGVNYTGKTATSFTGVTRAQAGSAVAGVATTWTAGSITGTVASATGIQVGQRVFSTTNPSPLLEGVYVVAVSGTTVTLSEAPTANNPTLIFAAIGATTGQAFTYSATAPVVVELAFPTFAPSISHWGTSVIMDGRFDDDKSLVFTYGQTAFSTIAAGATKAMFSIRVAPSVDQGIAGAFGVRDVINRMQLVLRNLELVSGTANATLLVRLFLNGVPSTTTAWQSALGGQAGNTSSLAQICEFGTGAVTISGGEVAGGFFVGTGASSIDLVNVRDLGNSILGGGGANSNSGIYPDGPDTMTIVVTNLGGASANVACRLSWSEAQA